MLLNYIETKVWLSMIVISLVYISDYYLTLAQSKLYQKGAKNHFEIEGGIELNPRFRDDINKQKTLSTNFIKSLIILNITTLMFYSLKITNIINPMEILFGTFLLAELYIHTKHLKSLFLYKTALKSEGIGGKIIYSRKFVHESSAIDLAIFAGFYLVLWGLSGKLFFVYGSLACLVLALSQKNWLKKYQKSKAKKLI